MRLVHCSCTYHPAIFMDSVTIHVPSICCWRLSRPRLLRPIWSCGCRVKILRGRTPFIGPSPEQPPGMDGGPCNGGCQTRGLLTQQTSLSNRGRVKDCEGSISSPLPLKCPLIFPLTPPELRYLICVLQKEAGPAQPYGSSTALGPECLLLRLPWNNWNKVEVINIMTYLVCDKWIHVSELDIVLLGDCVLFFPPSWCVA